MLGRHGFLYGRCAGCCVVMMARKEGESMPDRHLPTDGLAAAANAGVCPHCGVSLSGRALPAKPLPGQRRFLPLYVVPTCPDCGGYLRTLGGKHPVDAWLFCFVLVFSLLMSSVKSNISAFGASVVLVATAVLLALWGVVTIYLFLKYKRTPKYYERYDHTQRTR